MLAGLVDQVAKRSEIVEVGKKTKAVYNAADMEESVHMHSESVLHQEMPEWVVYQEIFQTKKVYLRGEFKTY